MPTCACENDRVGQKVADQVVKLVAKRREERRRGEPENRGGASFAIRLATIWDCSKNTQPALGFTTRGKSRKERESGLERFWFLWPQRELRVNHAPFENAAPHPRSISGCAVVRSFDELHACKLLLGDADYRLHTM